MVDGLALDALGTPPDWLPADTLARSRAALTSGLARETWKYSPLPKTLRMLLAAPLSSRVPLAEVPDGVTAHRLSELSAPPALPLDIERYPLAGIAAALAGEGWLIDVARSLDKPLVLAAAGGINAPVMLRVRAGCRVDVRESRSTPSVCASVRVLEADREASVTWAEDDFAADAEHWSLLAVRLGDGASLDLHQHAAGAVFRRLDTHIVLQGARSSCECNGASVVGPRQHLDRHQVVEHSGRCTRSRTALHNLAAAKSRCSYNGRIHIHPQAAGADAALTNKNLALDAGAEINTKPELEIYTDDVRCAHGATVGQLDEAALFYLRSRGLSETAARRILSGAFLAQRVQGPMASTLLQELRQRLNSALADSTNETQAQQASAW